MKGIKNLIFDFGNVLFDIDLSLIEEGLQQSFGEQYAAVRQKLQQNRIIELYETGGLSTTDFVETIRQAGHPAIPADQVIGAWNSIFIGMPAARFDMLLRLRQQYKVFLLSNINELHAGWITDYMVREHQIRDYESLYFDGTYFSHLVRLRKPDREIFEYVLADAELLPEETAFFDDMEINVEAARQVGIQGIWHPSGSDIVERMRTFEKL
ncbi:MAG: HAD family phosphatase [Saprospiraceae bacterium]